VATKDGLCVAELGAGYRTASRNDVQALGRSLFATDPFTVSDVGYAVHAGFVIYDEYTDVLVLKNYVAGNGVMNAPVACVRRTAGLQFTRALAGASGTVATKDGLCVAEFGAGYRTASRNDVQALYRSEFASEPFTVSNFGYAVYVVAVYGVAHLEDNGVGAAPVACVSF
jgi:hypothetical protein